MLYKISLRPNAQSHPVLIEMTIFINKNTDHPERETGREIKLKRCHFDEHRGGNVSGVRRNLMSFVTPTYNTVLPGLVVM